MSCALRIDLGELDVDAVMKIIRLEPVSICKKGEPRFPSKPEKGTHLTNSVNFLVSDAEFEEFDQQKNEAISFLKNHQKDLRELIDLPGVYGELDFGICKRDVYMQCDRFPPELLILAGSIGLEIALSQYPPSDDA